MHMQVDTYWNQLTLVLFWVGWDCLGGLWIHTGASKNDRGGEADVLGSRASWPHL